MLTTDYRIGELPRIAALYDIAKEKAWNAGKDLEWGSVSRPRASPIVLESSPFRDFEPYEGLSLEHKARANRSWHAVEVSDILHGEQGAMQIAAQLVELMPDLDAKLFASSQVFDEARHVEFFSRYLSEYVGYVAPPSLELLALLDSALADDRIDMKLITMQIVIESLAMAKFQRLRSTSAVPLLQIALDYILKDEARHVKFGAEVLEAALAGIDDDARRARSDYVLDTVTKLANNLNAAAVVADEFGWDKAAVRHHLRAKRIADPSEARSIFRQLQINLASVGLLTPGLREKLGARGLLTE
jgi:P-aminobenzoate N-oxygenase AurF